jgi:hypothetical protein
MADLLHFLSNECEQGKTLGKKDYGQNFQKDEVYIPTLIVWIFMFTLLSLFAVLEPGYKT